MAILGKAPVTYVEWRGIYHDALFVLGLAVHRRRRAKRIGCTWLAEDAARSVERHLRRLDRIERHLHECHERMDVTFLESVADAALGDETEPE